MIVQRKGPELKAVQYMAGGKETTLRHPNHNGWIVREYHTNRILFFTFDGVEALNYRAATATEYEVREAWGNLPAAKEGDWLLSSGDGILYVVSNDRFEADFVRV